tara:strand:- start:132 stop:455 length:324 start_codon:yes stop_codon:yes gene_type:complete
MTKTNTGERTMKTKVTKKEIKAIQSLLQAKIDVYDKIDNIAEEIDCAADTLPGLQSLADRLYTIMEMVGNEYGSNGLPRSKKSINDSIYDMLETMGLEADKDFPDVW